MSGMKTRIRPMAGGGAEPSHGQTFDELDAKILGLLLAEGRMSAREISFKLGVSTSTVTLRMERLRDRQIIRGFSAVVDFQKLGYDLTVVTEILVSKGKLLEMEREIAKVPGVCAVYDTSG